MVEKHVRMAEAKIVENSERLLSEGIGSCVVVCLRDSENNVGGMAHVVLPSGKMSNGSSKYADNILNELLEKIKEEGGNPENLEAKIFGGSRLFEFSSQIGDKNTKSVRKFMQEHCIPVIAEDTGGDKGRTVEFDPQTGKVEVEKCFDEKEIY